MRNFKYPCLLLVFLLPALISGASAAIYVENASSLDFSLNVASSGLNSSIDSVHPRIFTEHIDSILGQSLTTPSLELNNSLSDVRPRIFTEHIDSILGPSLITPSLELNNSLSDVRPRIFTEHIDSILGPSLITPSLELNNSLSAVRPRIFTEHIDSILGPSLTTPSLELNNSLSDVRPRIFTEHIDSIFNRQLNVTSLELDNSISQVSPRIFVESADMLWFKPLINMTPDPTIPDSITNLHETGVGTTWINWTWDNPNNTDFGHVIISINGTWKANTSANYFDATGLDLDTTYEIAIKTADIWGNVNESLVRDTAKTLGYIPDISPPNSITDLQNTTYAQNYINWSWINPTDTDFSHVMIFMNGIYQRNVTAPANFYNTTDVNPDTEYIISTHTVDTSGNINSTWMNNTTRTAPSMAGDITPPASINNPRASSFGTTWINWVWTNPSDFDFNHTMLYLDGSFVENTSDQYFNATNLIQGTIHTISTHTVDIHGNINETWVNDTAMTTGELPGGLSIKISKPSSYSFYPVGETVEFDAAVTDQIGNPVTSGISAYADLSGPDSTSRRIILPEDAGNFVGEYTVKGDDARGIWTVTINAFNATSSGQASLQLFFTGAYFIQPYTDSRSYLLGETANFTAKVVKPVGSSQPLTDKNLSLNLSVYQFNTTTLVAEPVEMVFDDTTGKFHGDVNTGLLGSGLFSVVFSGNDTDGNIETESLTIGVSEDFNIIVGTDKTYYGRNEPVNIHGSIEFIDGTPLSNTDVNLWISLKGFIRSYTATTNETGGFNYTFQPFAAEAGNYTITSTAVNLGLQRTAESHFAIHGLYLAPPSGTLNMVENSTQDIDFILYNLGETTLTGITATVNDLDTSDNVDATIVTTVPNELQPSESAYITLNVSAGTPVPENAAFFITVSTDQMSEETSELDVNLFSPNPVVVLEPDNIAVGLNQNQTALKTVTISNIGYGVLRNLTLTQPGYNWMRITSNTTIGDLKPGENTSFDIHIHSYNVSLGTYHDTVGITSDNHESMVVDLSASITDQTYGSLLFYVENELGQNISGASISLIDDTLYQEYTAITNSTGYALINDLPTGRYIYEVSSSGDNTLSQLNSVVVEPMEQPKRVNVAMQLSFIDFEWDVIPSTINDWYQIVLNMTFETDIPVPIIVAFPPHLEYNMNPGDVQTGTLTVANLGLVSLFDVSITPYINNNVQFTPIVSHIEELKAKSSVQIPYTIELAPSASSCDGFTGKISIKGKYIHFINSEGVASYTGTTVPLIINTPTCKPPEIGTGTIIGTVTDASDGSQIDNARVVAGRYYNDTDSSGSYTLTGVKSRTYTITAYKDGYYPISKTVVVTEDTTETVNFQLTPITTGPITGIVTNAIDGTPIEGARVAAGGRSDATDDSGSYTLSGVLTGSHTITASKRGFYTSSTTVLVTEDNTAVVNFQLTPIPETVYGSISGMVSDIDGEPLPFALVVTNGGFDFTDESGSYTITGVPIGNNSVIASKAWYHSVSKTVQVYEDCTTLVNFQLKKIIIPPVPIPDCECISGTPPVIWVYKGPDFGWLTPPPTTPSKMLVENCNDEGTIEFSDAYAVTISLNSLWIPSLSVNIGTILSSVYNIPVGDIWHNEFIPKQIDPNEETMLDVENMSRFFSDMGSFGITLPIPDIFGGALGFVYGPYPHDASHDCLKIIPLGGMEIKNGSINIIFPPGPGPGPGPGPDPIPGPDPVPPVFTETIHEIVQLSISQNATMERDAFWAGLGIRNRMPDTNIDNVRVILHISDENGSANDKFFIRAPRLEDISDIDGSGTISPFQLAKAQWLIIPKPGAGGVSGQTYNISADIAYSVNGTKFQVATENVGILVNPQPQLILDYYLPSDVIGNSPFKLAVMVTNDGYGTARNFSIETAQPVIYNPSGLMIDFEIIRSALQGEEISDSLKINFGDLGPGESKLAWWEMVVSMDGTFTEFTGDYIHSSELGGMETSLIKELNTNIIHREIETGDVNYRFLVTPKDDETYYLLLDPDSGCSTPVSIANYTIVSGPTPDNPNLDINIEDLTGQWVIVSIEDPYDNKVPILKVIRDSDGSEIPFYNYWMRDGRILIVDHYIEGFDGKYTIIYESSGFRVGQGAPTTEIEQIIIDAYNRNGGADVLGSPTTEVHVAWGYLVQEFPGTSDYAGGIIMYNPYKNYAYYIHGAIWERYYNLGGPTAVTDESFELGPPTSDIEPYVHTQDPEVSSHETEFRYQNFEGGSLEQNLSSGMVYEVHGAIYNKWKQLGAASSGLGLPTTDEKEAVVSTSIFTGRYSIFEGGIIHWIRELNQVWVIGLNQPDAKKIMDKYYSEGGSGGWLGFPVSNDYINPSGYLQCDFEGGYITTADGVNYEAFEYADKEHPTLLIKTPEYGDDAESYRIEVSGSASDESGMYCIMVNRNPIAYYNTDIWNTDVEFLTSSVKYWKTNVELQAGENKIIVTAIDKYHNSITKAITVYYNPDFSFAHITDVHIDDDTTFILDKWNIVLYSKSMSNFIGTLREVNDKGPAFILNTGDCVEYDNEELFRRFMSILDQYINEDTEIYHTAGNHDQRSSLLDGLQTTNLDNYNAIVTNSGPFTEFEDGHNDYYFTAGGYLFIGLESGEDFSQIEFLQLTPEGSGLQNDQMGKLNEILELYPNIPKVIFMHHPAINNGNDELVLDDDIYGVPNNCDEHGGNDGCIAQNRCEFIDNCTKYNVQLVLTGHTHEAHDFDANGKELYGASSYPMPYFIQTPSATKDKTWGLWPLDIIIFKHGYRIIDITNDNVCLHSYTPTSAHPKITGSLKCPAHLHAYDSQGGHIGLNASGDAEIDIPDSFYIDIYNYSDSNEPENILLYNTTEEYRFEIVANLTEEEKNSPEIESFNFTVEQEREDMRTTIIYLNVPLTENTTATLPINLTTTAYTMKIDYDGDAATDETRDPDFIEINYAPTAAIVFPETGSIYNESEPIEFNGTGRDPEDGILTNFSLVWYSDINGAIGAGERFSTANLSTGMHMITLMVNDSVDLVDTESVMITVVDRTPPSTIINLQSTFANTWINWTWTNPSDPDFNHTELYLNGTFITNIPAPQNYYNITGLQPDTSYELSTHTVDTSGNVNETWVNDTASTLSASGTTLNLYTGWNLISLPLMPEDTGIASFLSQISGNYSIVWEYNASDTLDHWKKFDPSAPIGNDLIDMEPGKGYWIMMISDDILPISGTVPESTDVVLKTGWNLIGYNSIDSQPVAEALSSISGNYSIVWAYDAGDTSDHWKKYDPGAPIGNDLTSMEPGKGYWIMMTSDDILKI